MARTEDRLRASGAGPIQCVARLQSEDAGDSACAPGRGEARRLRVERLWVCCAWKAILNRHKTAWKQRLPEDSYVEIP